MNYLLSPIGLRAFLFVLALQGTAYSQSVIPRSLAAADKAGVLEPYKDTDVATAEMGVVRELFVKPGDFVEDKAPIGRLDNDQQRFVVQEATLDADARGLLEAAQGDLAFNQRRFEETEKLVTSGKASNKELERYQMELSIARAKLRAQQEAKLISQARLEKVTLLLNERVIRAPHRGTIVMVHRDIGEYIAGNAPAIVRLVDTSKLRARFYLSDEDQAAERFRKLTHAEIRLANHVVVRAEIEFIAPFAIADGHVIEMTVVIDNEDGSIRSSSCELVQP